jgi:hypothetical protein
MCTRARPYRRAGRCGFGGRGVTQLFLPRDVEIRPFMCVGGDVRVMCMGPMH